MFQISTATEVSKPELKLKRQQQMLKKTLPKPNTFWFCGFNLNLKIMKLSYRQHHRVNYLNPFSKLTTTLLPQLLGKRHAWLSLRKQSIINTNNYFFQQV